MVEFGKLTPPYPSSALPPQDSLEAVPKYISGRTSYLRVRLAFHPYPQLIPAFCTRHGFGPPPRCYRGFNLAMGSSPGFGSNPDNPPGMMAALRQPSTASASFPLRRRVQRRPRRPASASLPPGCALFRLAFAAAPELMSLNQLPRLTRRLILQ